MTSDPALSGYGVVRAPGLYPAASLTVVANVELTTEYPVNVDFTTFGAALSPYIVGFGTGTVTSVSVVSANGLAGSVATATTTPAITLSTTITGILQGNGTAISAATTTGSGSVVLATSPSLVAPALGVATGTSLAIGGATLGTNALAVAGTAQISGQVFVPVGSASAPSVAFTGDTQTGLFNGGAGIIDVSFANSARMRFRSTQLQIGSTAQFGWSSTATIGVTDTILNRRSAANLLLGATDAAPPVAQTISVQGVVAGTTDTAGATWTFAGSVGTGTGVGGDIVFTVAPAGTTGSSQNAAVNALTLKGTKSVVVGSAALGTTATDGFLYIPTCAGTPTGVPTAFTGRVALIYDTTNKQFWIYDGAWLQPKTPAGAAIVTWQ